MPVDDPGPTDASLDLAALLPDPIVVVDTEAAAIDCVAWLRDNKVRPMMFLPLDTPGVAKGLGVSAAELNRTMHMRLADGRVVMGVEAWRELFRAVAWLRPLAVLLGVPGIHALAGAAYGWLAANRHCLGGACRMARNRLPHPPHRATTFLELP